MGHITKRTPMETTILNKKKLFLLIVFGVVCLFGALLIVIVDPLKLVIQHYSYIKNGSYVHELLTREIFGVYLSAYLFNITNPKEFLSGQDQKLKVEEVGPFTYQERRINDNLEIDSEAEVLRYSPRIGVSFLPEKSIGRPEDYEVTMPNLAMLSVASKVSEYSYLPRMGFNFMTYNYHSKPIITMSVNDYLWGYNEPIIKLGNDIIPQIVNFDTLGILDRLYDKKATWNYELSTKEEDKFAIKSLNGVAGLPMWDYEDPDKRSSCNSFENVFEGLAYPSIPIPERPLKIYRSILCRFLELDFVERRTLEYGAEGLFYKLSNNTFAINNSTKCLCSKGVCTEGISDMAPCFFGLPVAISNAHFTGADPKLYERVEGINPNAEKYDSGFTIDPRTGAALTSQFSVQLNILVRDVKFNSATSAFSDMLVPVGYFKIVQPPLLSEQIFNLRFIYIYGPYSVLFIQWSLVLAGLVLLACAVRILYGNWSYSARTMGITLTTDRPVAEQPLVP